MWEALPAPTVELIVRLRGHREKCQDGREVMKRGDEEDKSPGVGRAAKDAGMSSRDQSHVTGSPGSRRFQSLPLFVTVLLANLIGAS